MGTQRTWDLACERMAQRDRTMPAAQGSGEGGRMGGEMSPGVWRTGKRQRAATWASAKAQTRNPRPATGKGDWAEGENRGGYDDATNVLAGLCRTNRQRTLVAACRALLAERQRNAKLGDVPEARLQRMAREIRAEADLLANVTTGDVNRAALIAQGARNIAA